MTDARMPGRWLTAPEFDRLSDAAHRLFTNGLMHAADLQSDGAIERRSLRFLHPDPTVLDTASAELVDGGLWRPTSTGFQVVDWAETQSTRAQLTTSRENNRARQQRHRDKKKAPQAEAVTRDVTRLSLGKERQGITPSPPRELPARARARVAPDSDISRFCEHNVPAAECPYDPACRHAATALAAASF